MAEKKKKKKKTQTVTIKLNRDGTISARSTGGYDLRKIFPPAEKKDK